MDWGGNRGADCVSAIVTMRGSTVHIEDDAGESLPDLPQALREADAAGNHRTWNYPASVIWELDDDEPQRVLDRMREALDKPVLRSADS